MAGDQRHHQIVAARTFDIAVSMLCRRRLVNRPDEEIAEPFTGLSRFCVGSELFGQDFQDLVLSDIFGVEPVQALAMKSAAKPQIILAGRPSGESDFGNIGA